jgi:uncharacterized protein YrrD
MIKAGDILGRAVVVHEGGREAGKVKDLVVDQLGRNVLGFVVTEGFLRTTRVAPWQGLQVIGPDSVILKDSNSLVRPHEAPEIKEVLDGGTRIRGLRLQTNQGKDLGKVEDFRFDETTGEVEGYEISGRMFGGRSYLPTPPDIELGKDVAFISPESEGTITQAGGGIRSAFKAD